MEMGRIVEDVVSDIRVALRMMKGSPGFVVIAVVVLALGCAITGVVFSTVNGWLSVSAAIPHADRLIVIAPTRNAAADPLRYFKDTSYTRLFALKLRTVRDLFATQPVPALLSVGNESVTVRMEAVTGPYFRAVGVPPLLGRPLQPDDDLNRGGVSVVLGETAWRRLFNADARVIGRSVRLSGLPGTVVGVMPSTVRGFSIPTSTAVDVWAPLELVRSLVAKTDQAVWGQVFGRLAEGASFREAEAEMHVAGTRFDPDDATLGAAVFPVERGVMPSRARLAMRVIGTGLVALSSLVLVIACANLANLLLARGASRSSEIAIRMALGASSSRILRQQLLETGIVTALGGAAGFVLVSWTSHLIGRFTLHTDGGGIGNGTVLVDIWVLAYFFVLIAAAALAIGILPAIRAIRIDPGHLLASSGSRGRTTGRFERKRTLLVASQVAASTVLLIVAGLFVRSALHASRYDVAFDTRHLAMGYFNFGMVGWDEQRGRNEQVTLLAAARTIPGIRAAAVATGLPAGGGGELVPLEAEDANLGERHFGPACRCLSVSPGFFQVLGPLPLRGRDFTAANSGTSHGVVIVNEVAASRLWPGRDPIGRRLRIRKGAALDVVGVVAETDTTTPDSIERCYVFVPMAQRYTPQFSLVVAGTPGTASLVGPLAATVAREVPDVSMFDVKTAEAHLNRAGGPSRSIAIALSVLGALALTIALAGLYGVMSYVVGLRRAEFGIRKVLGATDAQIYRLVSWEACRMVGIGILPGLPVAYWVSVTVSSALIGVTSHDALTYLVVPVCLMVVGVLAACWPAWQAARVAPAVALRDL
ncbi:ABC transporter permease [soil metagenome]